MRNNALFKFPYDEDSDSYRLEGLLTGKVFWMGAHLMDHVMDLFASGYESDRARVLVKWPELVCMFTAPSLSLQMFAVNNCPESLAMFNVIPHSKVQFRALELDGSVLDILQKMDIHITEKHWQLAIETTPGVISNYYNPPVHLQLLAVGKQPHSIRWISNPALAAQILAVKRNPSLISDINKPLEIIQLAAMECDPSIIRYIIDPCEKAQMIAVQHNTALIKHIAKPTDQVRVFVDLQI
jgi:hypothetical protein